MPFIFGGGGSRSEVSREPPTPEEREILRIQGAIMDQLYQGFVRENASLSAAYPWMAALTRTSAQAATQQAQLARDRTNAAIRGAPIEEQAFYDAAAMMGIGRNVSSPMATGGGRFAALYEPIPSAVSSSIPGPAGPPGPPGPAGGGGADPNRPGTEAGGAGAPGLGEADTSGAGAPGDAGTGGTGGAGAGGAGSAGADASAGAGSAAGTFKMGGMPGAGQAVPSSPMIDFSNPAAQAGLAAEQSGSGAAFGGGGVKPTGLPLMAAGDQDVANAVQAVLGTVGSTGRTAAQNLTAAVQGGQTTAQGIAEGLIARGYDPRVAQGVAASIAQSVGGGGAGAGASGAAGTGSPAVTGGAAGTSGATFNPADVDRVVYDVLGRTGGQFQVTPFGLERARTAATTFLQRGMTPEQASNALLQYGMSGNLPETFGTGRVTNPGPSRLGAGAAPSTTAPSNMPPGARPTGAALADLIVQDSITRSGLLPTQEGYVQALRQVDRMMASGATPEQISDQLIANARSPAGQSLIASRAPTPGGTGLSVYERGFQPMSEGFATQTLGGQTIDPLSGAEMGRIGTVFNTASRRADEDVSRFSDELAGVRGLRQTDTPIGAVTVRERSRLAENIRGAQASTELTMGQQQRQFREGVRQFQEGLRQQAFANRLQLTGRSGVSPAPPVSAPAFGSSSGANAVNAGSGILNSLGANRGTTTTTSNEQGFPIGNLISAGGAVVGGLAAGRFFSTARVKKAIEPFDRDEYDRALRKLRETPVTRWRYVWEPDDGRKHTGPILEMSPEEIREDDTRIDLLSYVGMNHAALKGLDRKVDRLAETFLASAGAA